MFGRYKPDVDVAGGLSLLSPVNLAGSIYIHLLWELVNQKQLRFLTAVDR